MRALPKTLYFLCFVLLAFGAAWAFDRVGTPSMSETLVWAVMLAALAAAPGLIYRRAWPLTIVLMPSAAYLFLRMTLPLPAEVEGAAEQYRFYAEALHTGGIAYLTDLLPLNLTDQPELLLLLGFSAFWLVGAAAFLGIGLRSPIPAVALLLILFGFGATVDGNPRSIVTALFFLILCGGLVAFSQGITKAGRRVRDGVSGAGVAAVGGVVALVLVLAAPSAVAQPWKDWRAWDPFDRGDSVYTFNWMQNYPRLLNPANNVPIMTVTSPVPSYWRANALDTFTGSAWVATEQSPLSLESVAEGNEYVFVVPESVHTAEGELVEQFFSLRSVYTNFLFVGGDPRTVIMSAETALRVNDTRSLHARRAMGPTLSYRVTAVVPELEPQSLVGRGSIYPQAVQPYLRLPFPRLSEIEGPDTEAAWNRLFAEADADDREWVRFYALNRSIVGDASDPYEKTLLIEQRLRRSFAYSLNPRAGVYSSPFAAFLFDTRTGYCQHFAGAMAVLLRFNGIPARVAVGFTTGEEQDGRYIVSTNNAHAWVEAYFPEIGWVAFDPTPGRNLPGAGASSTNAGFVSPFADSGSAGAGSVVPTLPRAQFPQEEIVGGGGSTEREARGSGLLPWVLVPLLLLFVWPPVLHFIRHRGLNRGTTEQRLQASLRLLRAHLADYGSRVSPALTIEETMGAIEGLLNIQPDPGLAERVDAVLFGGMRATREDLERAESLRRQVRIRLQRRHGWVRAALACYGVRRRGRREPGLFDRRLSVRRSTGGG